MADLHAHSLVSQFEIESKASKSKNYVISTTMANIYFSYMFNVSYYSQTEQRTQIAKSNFIVIDSDCAIKCRKYFDACTWFGCGNCNSEKIYDFKQKAKGRSFGCNSNNTYKC